MVDASGHFINCTAMGQNAKSSAIEDNREIIIYFGNARDPLGSTPGSDASIVPQEKKSLPLTATQIFEIEGTQEWKHCLNPVH